MERFLALFVILLGALTLPGQVAAQDQPTSRTISTERWVEEWDPVAQRWVRVSDSPDDVMASGQAIGLTTTTHVTTTQIANGVVVEQTQTVQPAGTKARFAVPQALAQAGQESGSPAEWGGAQYGPFRVLDAKRVAIVATTDQMSSLHFDAMMRDYPGLEVLEMLEAPGTRHDIANLSLGRKIRAAGLRTHVPAGGSVRSGAVELFLAGTTRTMDDGAEFAVHSWLDDYGREPQDFPEDHPANRLYLDYYMEMGMSEGRARDFYAMTNSVPHSSALWLEAGDMRPWIPEARMAPPAPHMFAAAARSLPVAASLEAPLVMPQIDLDKVTVEAPEVTPSIAYADLPGFSVAQADVRSPGVTLLDSGRAFP